jgi:prevent-host-death family protein
MKTSTVTATELKNRLGRYLKQVRLGSTIVVTDRGRAIGRLIPEEDRAEAVLQRMMAAGLVTRRPKDVPLPRKRIRLRGKPLSQIIIEERERGR